MSDKHPVRKALDMFKKFFDSRVYLLGVIVCVLFYILFVNLYNLLIMEHTEYVAAVRPNTVRTVYIDAPRGNIFDRTGQPLAVNEPVDVIRIDPVLSAVGTRADRAALAVAVIEFVRLAQMFGEEVIRPETIQITQHQPYEFTSRTDSQRHNWLLDMAVVERSLEREYALKLEAYSVMERLYGFFSVPEQLPNGIDRRLVLEICAAVYMQRYRLGQITLARDIGPRLAAAVEERGAELPSFYTDVEFLRIYPAGEYVAHLIGYIRPINDADFERFSYRGYLNTDLFGVSGVERAFQISGELSGTRGVREVEIDHMGRRVSNVVVTPPTPGNDIFLTIDLTMQKTAVRSIEQTLTGILANKISGVAPAADEAPVTPQEVIRGLLRTNNFDIADIMEAEDGFRRTVRTRIETFIELENNENSENNEDSENVREVTVADIRAFLIESVMNNSLNANVMVGVLVEQGVVSASPEELDRLGRNAQNLPRFLAERVTAGQITPQMAFIRPYAASAVVVCPNTGAVLVAANYPNYDNNRFVNARDNAYITRVNTDPTHPLLNRAFQTNRPPGSTFKMITAVAGLETGAIRPNTLIHDGSAFTRAGTPHVRCWIFPGSHGSINVAQAIEVSCNYFFYETAFRMGGNTLERIDALNVWMRKFGLDSQSGVETGNIVTHLSSPAHPNARNWTDNATVLTAIGQSLNDYNTVVMAKYMATLANGGYRFQSHLLHRVADTSGQTVRTFEPVLEEDLAISAQTLNAVFDGMHRVFYGPRGTARGFFDDFPIVVGGKTGTAQNGTPHSDVTFAAFAPFNNPQIAVYVMLPFGDTAHFSLPAGRIAADIFTCFFQVQPEEDEAEPQPVSLFTN